MKIETLKKRKDFIISNKLSYKSYNNFFILQKFRYSKDNNLNFLFGFTATKRVGNAVIRNRARRRMKSLINLFIKNNISSFENGYSYVLIAKIPIIKAPFRDLISEMKNSIDKLR